MSDTPITDNAERQCQCSRGCHVSSFAMEEIERELNRYKAAVAKFLALASDTCRCKLCRTAREVKASLERRA